MTNKYGNIPEFALYIKIDGYTLRKWIDSYPGVRIKEANYIISTRDNGEAYFESFYAHSKNATLSLINTPYGQVVVKQCKTT